MAGVPQQERDGRYSIAIFPFLKTSVPVTIGRLTFRSTEDTSSLNANQARSVAEVAEMLFLQNDLRVKSASYCIIPFIELDGPGVALEKLKRLRTVVGYCYAIPPQIFGHPHLHYEDASLVIFSPGR